jgi:response regulator RpfG family c-di-GMP phosphodiesterase
MTQKSGQITTKERTASNALSDSGFDRKKVLMVDDEKNVLEGYKRYLHREFNLSLANSGKEALEMCKTDGPFSVVISDQKMPQMDGVQFLSLVKERYPDSVRMMLTGQADMDETIAAVNEGNIFRFLTKPCNSKVLSSAINDGLEQYRLIIAEKEILDKTLKGSIQVLLEVLSLTSPISFGRASRVTNIVNQVCERLDYKKSWDLEIASSLAPIGLVTIPDTILRKVHMGRRIADDELKIYNTYTEAGFRLMEFIPRLETVARFIKDQKKKYNKGLFDAIENEEEKDIHIGLYILSTAFDFDHFIMFDQMSEAAAIAKIINEAKVGLYNMTVAEALQEVIFPPRVPREITAASQLKQFMIIAADIVNNEGTVVLLEGHTITPPALKKIVNEEAAIGLKYPIKVWEEK